MEFWKIILRIEITNETNLEKSRCFTLKNLPPRRCGLSWIPHSLLFVLTFPSTFHFLFFFKTSPHSFSSFLQSESSPPSSKRLTSSYISHLSICSIHQKTLQSPSYSLPTFPFQWSSPFFHQNPLNFKNKKIKILASPSFPMQSTSSQFFFFLFHF